MWARNTDESSSLWMPRIKAKPRMKGGESFIGLVGFWVVERERERKLSFHQLLSATWFYCFDAISGIVGEFFVSVIRNRWTRNQLRYGSWYFSIRCSMYAVLVILNFADKTFLRPLPSLPSASVFITLARATRSRPTKSYEVLLLFTAGACWFPSAAIDAASAVKCGGFNVSAALAEPHE